MPTQLDGQFDLVSAIETVALPSNTDVASFTDANTSDEASAFTATIDWGDGVTTNGTVVGQNGSFEVQGGHTYGDDNFFSPVVTVVRNADNSTLVLNGGVNVSDVDNIHAQSASTIVGNPNQALNNVVVATFTDTNNPNNQNDLTVSIDWGDGTVTGGTITGSNGSFTVTGSHTYSTSGNFSINTFIADDSPDSSFDSATTQAAIGFGGTETFQFAQEQVATASGTQVATFNDTFPGTTAADYTASIDWGDGTTTTGTVSGSNGSFAVTSNADHTYGDEGLFTGTVTITRTTDNSTIAPSGTVTVSENDDLSATGTTINGTTQLNNVVVATFTDHTLTSPFGPTGDAADFIANIDWGDGSSSLGTITGSNGSFTVTGSHTYAQPGQDTVTVNITEDASDGQSVASATATTTVTSGFGGTVILQAAAEHTVIPAGTGVATFADNAGLPSTAYTATIDWGDGTTTLGTVSGSNGSFTVSSALDHTYGDEASVTEVVTITRITDNAVINPSGTVIVGENDSFSASGTSITGSTVQNNVTVATVSDTDTVTPASDIVATIDWGDGVTTAGTVSGSNGSFAVSGSHSYAASGHYTISVHGGDDDPGTATFDATSTADVIAPIMGHMVLTSATEHVALANSTAVAVFTDGNHSDTAGQFTATIDWGDGVTTSGTVVGSNGSFTVDGGHTYADEGTDTAVVTLTHHPDNSQATASGPVTVGEHDVLTGQNMHAAIVVNQPFSGVVGHFTDTDHVTPAGDFVATIDWGDGATTSGTVSGSNGSFDVSGTHAYTTVGLHRVLVTLTDDAPGTATATAEAKIVFNNSNGHHSMADTADTSSLHVSTDGTTGPAGQTVGEVPDNWDMVGFGQFSGPSTADVINTDALFVSDAGQVIMWQSQNGVLTTDQLVGQVPTNWHFFDIQDVNGDGKSDILWESDAGAQQVWEMNGTQVVADHPFDPNAPLASHVLDGHAPTMPAVSQPVDTGPILGGIAGTVYGALHDPHFLV